MGILNAFKTAAKATVTDIKARGKAIKSRNHYMNVLPRYKAGAGYKYAGIYTAQSHGLAMDIKRYKEKGYLVRAVTVEDHVGLYIKKVKSKSVTTKTKAKSRVTVKRKTAKKRRTVKRRA